MIEPILSPLNYYIDSAQPAHSGYTRAYLDLLLNHASVDRTANAQTVQKYNAKQKDIKKLQQSVSSNKSKRTWAIIGIIAAFVFLVMIISNSSMADAGKAPILALGLGLGIFGIVKVCKSLNKKNRTLNEQIAALQTEANEFLSEAQGQVAPLLSLFTNDDALNLFTKTLPFITFDKFFSGERLSELVNEYGFSAGIDSDESVLDTLSGELYGSPFVYVQKNQHHMGRETYHGSLSISWTTESVDSQGNRRTEHHSETLHASVTKPKPYFKTDTALYFGNKAVPNCNFSRTYKHMEDRSEASVERAVRAGEKKIQRKEAKALKTGDDFMGTLNVEFDVIFGATNRTDDYEFRQMFTVRAQESMLELLLYKDGYGDDFSFVKQGKICIIRSEHAQGRPLSPSVYNYYSHDLEEIESSFIKQNETFFRSVYFDFAPLLLIPPYQQPLVRSRALTGGRLTAYNYESLANKLSSLLIPDGIRTDALFSTSLLGRSGNTDSVEVIAYGYCTEKRVDYESVYGGDGHWHQVPVEWTEYIPVKKRSVMKVVPAGSDSAPSGSVYHRGYYAYL